MESNGTFRVLSSLDTRTSSVVCGSFGNLTAPGTSFGSGDGTGFDLIQGTHSGNGTFVQSVSNSSTTTAITTATMASSSAIVDASTNPNSRQSVNMSLDQALQPYGSSGPNATRDMNSLADLSGKTHDAFGVNGWNKAGEPPPDLCLSSTYPNLCEEQHDIRDTGQMMIMTRQPVALSNLSPRQSDQSSRRNLVGEYENLESLSNDNLNHLRSTGQVSFPVSSFILLFQ